MGECGCGPDDEHVYRIGENLVYVCVNWHTCTGCEAGPAVQLIRDKYVVEAAIENGVKVEELREPDETHIRTGAVIAGNDDEDRKLLAALSHLSSQHVHDAEECPDWLTKKGTLRAKPDIYNDWPPNP